MPQSTNLNRNPYYDDFNQNSNYYKVLFKPGVTVQARELTTLQSILQNQLERFGSKFFSTGSGQVIPGGYAFDDAFYAVEIEYVFKGVVVEDYYKELIGKILVGKTTGVKAKVYDVISREESDRNSTTIFVKYQSSDGTTFEGKFFNAGEELLTQVDIAVGESFIFANESAFKIASFSGKSPFSTGSAAKIDSGVYFVRGYFVSVDSQVIILDQYNNKPSCRVGLSIVEDIVDSNEDSSLNDNAQGFSNFAAPGADRLSIKLILSKKPIDDFNDDNFIELFRVKEGVVQTVKIETVASFIDEVLARRTFDESGNYTVDDYDVDLADSLNDKLDYFGIYSDSSKTAQGSVPSKDLGIIKISSGKSYVKGFEVLTSQTNLDYPKPRTTKKIESASATFYAGNQLKVYNVSDMPTIGGNGFSSLEFYNRRLGIGSAIQGDLIAVGRAYDFEIDNTPYEGESSIFNLYIVDLQTITKLETTTIPTGISNGFYVQGKSSGASGFVYDINTNRIELYQVAGKFISNENLVVNGISSTSTIGTVTDYSIRDIKSVTEDVSGFKADVYLSKDTTISGPFFFETDEPTGILTITKLSGSSFASNLKVGDVINYETAGITTLSLPTFVRITSIASTKNSVTTVGVNTVTNVNYGNIGLGTYIVQNIKIKSPDLISPGDSSLYSPLNKKNVYNVDFLNSNIYVRRQYTGITKSAGVIDLPDLTGTDYVYVPFDEERYIVTKSTGFPEKLTSSNFTLGGDGKTAQITGLSGNDTCVVLTTQQKAKVTAKTKKLNRVQSITWTYTKYTTPKNAGLSFSDIYGTRIEDQEISLNQADIVEVHGVFESLDNSDPVLPGCTLTGLTSPTGTTSDLIIGEAIVGSDSGAVAIFASVVGPSEIKFIYKNDQKFSIGEKITFKETGYTSDVSSVDVGSPNIVNEFILDNGQRKSFYDIGRLIRKNGSKEPASRLKIYFDYFAFESTDDGDLISANSYPSNIYGTKIPKFDGYRNTDIIDVRPRTVYVAAGSISPFDFRTRAFDAGGQAGSQVLVSYENFIFDYDFYLPRTDKLVLDKNSNFKLILGEPSETPVAPKISSEELEVATIIAGPYIYDVEDPTEVSIILTDNRRFTMKDIRDIESRVDNLEYFTSLSLLETSTQNLLIEDEDGLNRFKSGFFVDNFSNSDTSDVQNVNYRGFVTKGQLIPELKTEKTNLSLYPTDIVFNTSEIDLANTACSNLKLTGTTLTLDYSEVEYLNQPFASKIVNVNPYAIVSWQGKLKLIPEKDTWTQKKTTYNYVIGSGPDKKTTTVTDIEYARSRNINFEGTILKPTTRYHMLFDSKNLSDSSLGITYAFPKILEISNVKGAFKVGETVVGSISNRRIYFRVALPNHKTGPHNAPTTTFATNPYNPTVGISTLYGSASTILNVDLDTLQIPGTSKFYGNAIKGMILKGKTSKATAVVSDVRLITDAVGDVFGSIWIPDPKVKTNPKFKNGSLNARLESVFDTTLNIPGEIPSFAESTLTTKGTLKTTKVTRYYDPLAQSFVVDEQNGIFPTSVDVYFQSKDDTLPVTLQIREVVNGTPGGDDKIVKGLIQTLNPSQVSTSKTGTTPTTFTFKDLIRLEGNKEYALVLVSESDNYNVWVSEVGQVEISTLNSPSIDKIYISKQPSLGSLFKSQNSSTWTPCQLEDLKYKIKRAEFITTGGTARFYNTKVETDVVENKLSENPLYCYSNSEPVPFDDGRHMLVFHPNHGLNAANNKVTFENIFPDTIPTKITVSYGLTETGPISVGDTSAFATYNGSVVGPDNLGYALMNDEIIRYNEFAPGQLKNIQRATQGSISVEHPIDSFIYKYEFNGVPLSAINNTTHDVVDSPAPTLDEYYVQIGVGYTFTSTKFGGGENVCASKNKVFHQLELAEDFVTICPGTTASASVRTVSATSVDSNEVSFIDQGYQDIDLLNENVFSTPRMVASHDNENTYLNATEFIGNKSLTVDFNLNTSDVHVSPVIELNQLYVTLDNYRINNPIGITSYVTDKRVNSNTDDPHGFIHISKKINLQETANSIKLIITAYRPAECEIRALYKVFRNDTPDETQVWELFPGYDNLDVNGKVKDTNANNGRPDKNVSASIQNQFKEYTFTINDLPEFTGFAIKLVGTTTNRAIVPIVEDIRALALK